MNYPVLLLVVLLSTQQYSATPLAIAPLDLIGKLVTAGSVIEKLVSRFLSKDPLEEVNGNLEVIRDQLEDIQRSIDSVRQDLADLPPRIESFHEMTRNVAAFGTSLNRLNLFRSQAVLLEKDDLGLLLRSSFNERWAAMIDSDRSDGVHQIIMDIDCMIKGCNRLIGKSLLFKYIDSLPVSTGDVFWDYVTDMSNYLINLQLEAYIYLFQALDIRQATKTRYSDKFIQSLNEQKESVFSVVFDRRLRYWPDDAFSTLLADRTGCPGLGNSSLVFRTGWRYHDTEDSDNNNDASSPYSARGHYRDNIKIWFCNKDSNAEYQEYLGLLLYVFTGTRNFWPPGRYCVFKYGYCPTGMQSHILHMSDEHDDNRNSASGTVPDGDVGSWYEKSSELRHVARDIIKVTNFGIRSTYEYCCKRDDVADLVLPVSKPFYLIPYVNTGCPNVAHMKSREEWLRFDGDDGWTDPLNYPETSYQVETCEHQQIYGPKIWRGTGQKNCQNVKMYFCFYERHNF